MYELNLLLIALLSVASVFIISLVLAIRRLKNERDFAQSKNEADSKILFLKSRYASMGETVGNIAHQWKQPLNAIGSIQNSIKASLIFQGEISKEKLLDSVEKSFKLLQHLAETIDTFYSFLSQRNSEEMSFAVADELEAIRKITEYSFQNSHIHLDFILDATPMIQGNANEFTHALLNLILNAKDAFDDQACDSPTITVRVSDGNDLCTITISDNAGGIRVEPIDMVFDLHISTKEEGSGLGLFMTKNIIEKRFGGTIGVENINGGACFTIKLPYAEYGEYFSPEAASDEKLSLARINQLTHKIIELEELEKTLRKWADIFEQAQWGIVIGTVEEETVGLMNPAFAIMHGYSIQELTGKPAVSLFAPECLDDLKFAIETAHREGHYSFESIHLRKDGSRFPVAIEVMAIKDENGEVMYRIVNVWDITEKKASEERLLLKKFALDHIKDAVFLIDENANFQYINDGAYRALGYKRGELNSMSVADIDPNWPKERWPQHWNDIKEHKTVLMESICQRKDGSVFPIEISSNYFEYDGVGYTLAIVRDITERLQLEEQKDNERMKLFFERQLVGMAITSPQKGWLHTNEKLQEMLGYTHEELKQLTWAQMTHPEDLAPDVEQFEKLLRDEIEDYILEKRFIRKDRSIVYTNLAVSCVRNDDRSVNYVLALLEDITERKAAQEALAAKEREFRSLAENIPDNIARWDVEGRYLYINPVQERLLGITPADIIGKRLSEAFPEIDFSVLDGAISQVVKTGKPIQFLRQLVPTEDGIMDIHEINLVPERDANGTIISVLGVGRDMTHIYRLQNELEKREKELRALADTSPGMMGAFHMRPDGSVYMPYVSPNILDIFGVTPEEVQEDAIHLMALNHPDDAERVGESIASSAQSMSVWHEEYRIIHPTKGVRWMESNTMPQLHPQGGIIWYGYVHDITKRKELEALLEKERKFLIDAQRVSHTGSWHLDIQNSALSWSDETYRIFELEKEEVDDLHKTFYECVHPDDREMVQVPYVESLKTKLPYQVEHRIVMRDGRIKYVIERCEHSYDNNGTPLYSIGTIQDITERKAAEEALQSNRNLLYAILESAPGVITFALDKNYRYIAYDSKHQEVMRTIFGKEIAVGMNMLEVIGSLIDRDVAKRSFDRALRDESFIAEEEYGDERLSRKYWQIFYSPIRSETGEVIGLTCFNLDITERRRIEEKIQNLNTTLEKRVFSRTAQLEEAVTTLHKEITERKETEKQLKLVEFAVNSSTEAIYINDRSLSILYVNDGACRMLGYTREELISMKIYDIDALFSEEQIVELRENIIVDKRTFFETKHKTKEGRIVDVEIVGNPFIYEGIEAIISVVKEITGRKQLEEKMHVREQYQRTLLDNFPYFVWLKDQDSRLLAANLQYARVAKVESTADLEGKTDFDFFPRELAQKYVDDDQTVMREGLTKNEEEQYADEHGQIHWMETWKSPVWVNGHIVGTVGCSRDITERKRAAEALNESEQRYKEIFENTSDSIYLMEVTEDGRFRNIAANPAFVRSIGIPLEMLVGSYVGDLTDEETTETVIAKYRRCIEAGVPTEEITELDLPIGRKKFCSTLIPIKDESGRVYRIIGLAKDITEKEI